MSSGQKINFVTGKGGVGKSLFAASLALAKSKRGENVLLLEIGENSYYKDFFGLPSVTHKPVSTGLGFDVALWSGETCLHEYIHYYLKLDRLLNLFFENSVMRSLINVAPGLNEIAILGKITSGIRNIGPSLEYKRIVVDCYASGHVMALFRASRGMHEAVPFGPMGRHANEITKVLKNPEICSYHIVTLLEEMPVVESFELAKNIYDELQIKPEIFANKVLNSPVSVASLNQLIQDPKLVDINEFAQFLRASIERQNKFLSELSQKSSQPTIKELPLVFSSLASEIVKRSAELEFLRDL